MYVGLDTVADLFPCRAAETDAVCQVSRMWMRVHRHNLATQCEVQALRAGSVREGRRRQEGGTQPHQTTRSQGRGRRSREGPAIN
eukprot:8022817-Prorocentrum_lima.AAC.1